MFEAYSCNLKRSVNASDVTNLLDTFKCLNPECNAIYTLRSINGKRSPYFGRRTSTPHINNCPYDIEANRYLDSEDMIKSDVYKIYKHEKNISNKNRGFHSQTSSTTGTAIKHISTPKQLLNYCISNKLTTTYMNGITVGDIIVDNRNILQNKNYKGVSGLRLILGNTICYDSSTKVIYFDVSTVSQNNKRYYLTASICLTKIQFDEILRYILKKNNRIYKEVVNLVRILQTILILISFLF